MQPPRSGPRDWRVSLKPQFLTQLNRLSADDAARVSRRVEELSQDPLPDGHQKKKLRGYDHVFRARAGKLRLLYTLGDGWLTLLKVEHRRQVYESAVDSQTEEPPEVDDLDEAPTAAPPNWHRYLVPQAPPSPEPEPLPEPITPELLVEMRIPEQYQAALTLVEDRDALLGLEGIPEEILIALDERLLGRPLPEVLDEPRELELQQPEDLLRYHQGDLVEFLLRLSPEQERFVEFHLEGAGPTLLEGGPGSGKSIVALHRVRAAIERLVATGVNEPRVLFTTYTTTLCAAHRQLLDELLPEHATRVRVTTVDQLVYEVARELAESRLFLESAELAAWISEMLPTLEFEGNSFIQEVRRKSLQGLPARYLADELTSVLQARRLRHLDAYLEAPRPHRALELNDGQRRAVFTLLRAIEARCVEQGRITWSALRAGAADRVESDPSFRRYDAVVIDEAQDLEPAALAVAAGHAVSGAALFLAADPSQSVYGPGFDWHNVHRSLNVRAEGRGRLSADYRTTAEIGTAARAYLAAGGVDTGPVPTGFSHRGPLPTVHATDSVAAETELLERFLRSALRELHLGPGAGAVLVPDPEAASAIADALSARGLRARAQKGDELDLRANEVKVISIRSAKGLEFPVVAVAGFHLSPIRLPRGDPRAEVAARERRTLYVAMTRAMRALLVALPAGVSSPLFTGFDPALWHLPAAIDHRP